MQVICNEERKARKEHRCSFCAGVIAKGEVYQYAKIRGDELYAWKSHKKCEKILAHLHLDDGGDGITQLDFCDGVSDALCDLKLHEKVDALLFVLETARERSLKNEVS